MRAPIPDLKLFTSVDNRAVTFGCSSLSGLLGYGPSAEILTSISVNSPERGVRQVKTRSIGNIQRREHQSLFEPHARFTTSLTGVSFTLFLLAAIASFQLACPCVSEAFDQWTSIHVETAPITGLAVDPADSDNVYAATNGNGIWASTDSGQTWHSINTGLITTNSENLLAIAPSDSNIMYALTSDGVWKSTNSGETWTYQGSSIYIQNSNAMLVDRSNPGTVYIGTEGSGLWESTNGGSSWRRSLSAGNDSVQDVATDQSGSIYAVFCDGTGLWKSSNHGTQWNRITTSAVNIGDCLYRVAVDPSNAGNIFIGSDTGLWRTTNGGTRWSKVFNGASYDNGDIAIHPLNPSVIYTLCDGHIYKSTDSGNSWTDSGLPRADYRGMAIDPAGSKIFVGRSDGAVLIGRIEGVSTTTVRPTTSTTTSVPATIPTTSTTSTAKTTAPTTSTTTTIPPERGSVSILISPAQASSAGAGWKVDEGSWQRSGATVSNIATGPHTVTFKEIAGWIAPEPQSLVIANGTKYRATGIYVQPIAVDFSASPLSGKAPLAVKFTDKSTGTVMSRLWEFGDGGTSTSPKPAYTYTKAGTYSVKLTITGPAGSEQSKSQPGLITVYEPARADFIGSPQSGVAELTVQFTDKSKGAAGWLWNFGDGQTSTDQNPSHTYSKAGKFTVTLTATGQAGPDTKKAVNFITVLEPPPSAEFSASSVSGRVPFKFAFTDHSTGNIKKWSWNFGDGGTSTAKNPVHTYKKAGSYTTSLTVTGPGGSNTRTKGITAAQ